MNTTEPRPTIVSTIGQLCRRDAAFVPAMFIAVVGTVSTVVAPPGWIGRVPTAIGDVVTGGRQTLRAENAKASEDLARLRDERDALSTRLSAAESENRDTLARLTQTEQALVDTRSGLSDATQIVSTSETAIGEQRRRLVALDQELNKVRSELAQQIERQQLVTAKLERQDAGVTELRAERDRLRKSFDTSAEQIAAGQYLEARLAEVKRERDATRITVRDKTQSIAELERQAARRTVELSEARSQIASGSATIARLFAERDATAAVAEGQTVQVQELARLRGAAAAASKIDVDNKRIIRSQQERLTQLDRDIEDLRTQIANKNDEIESLDPVQVERAQLAMAVPRLERTVAELSKRAAAAEDALQVKVQALTKALSETDQINSTLRTTEAQMEAATDAEEVMRSLQNKTTATLAQARRQLQTRTRELAGKVTEVSRVVAQLSQSQSELTRNRVLISSEQKKGASLTLQANAVQGEVMRLLSVLRASEENSARLKKSVATAGLPGAGGVIPANLEELYRFRSEFFSRLSGILGDREDIRQVGDRFVFQAEVLFDSGSAELGDSGRAQLAKVASTLKEIAKETPVDLNWILRVDGHTDRNPIQTSAFPSNWELSASRAISVVKFFIEHGVPAERLSANGLGEYQPLDDSDSPIAYSRNRRIELKLTER